MLARTGPCLASEGAVLKNHPPSSSVVKAGEVAEGEIETIPLGTNTLVITHRYYQNSLDP